MLWPSIQDIMCKGPKQNNMRAQSLAVGCVTVIPGPQSLVLQIAQSRSWLHTSGPKVGLIHILWGQKWAMFIYFGAQTKPCLYTLGPKVGMIYVLGALGKWKLPDSPWAAADVRPNLCPQSFEGFVKGSFRGGDKERGVNSRAV